MIVEAIIGGVTLVTLGSLWLADRVHKRIEKSLEEPPAPPREPTARERSFAERRRVLERVRNERYKAAVDCGKASVTQKKLNDVNQQYWASERALLKLAEDEAADA